MIKAGIIGSTGYVGEELARILLSHPDVELSCVTSQSYIGKKYSQIYENFNKITNLECQEQDIQAIADDVDVIFLALPHGIASAQINDEILKKLKLLILELILGLKAKTHTKFGMKPSILTRIYLIMPFMVFANGKEKKLKLQI
ncbi:MAG: hypothetical protein MZU97_01690 [Bacillus subtilis]|nr:hypothetical protein [Bacillus subtilis]